MGPPGPITNPTNQKEIHMTTLPTNTSDIRIRTLSKGKLAIRVYIWSGGEIASNFTLAEDYPVVVKAIGGLKIKEYMLALAVIAKPEHETTLSIEPDARELIGSEGVRRISAAYKAAL